MDFFKHGSDTADARCEAISLLLRVFVVGVCCGSGGFGECETAACELRPNVHSMKTTSRSAISAPTCSARDGTCRGAREERGGRAGARQDLKALVTKKIARGVAPSQIMQAIQKLGQPTNCRSLETLNVSVATPLYGGPESKASLFDGGLNLHVEGQAGGKSARDVPSFDPKLPLTVRMAFLNGQKVVGDIAVSCDDPHRRVGAASRLQRFSLHGYVSVSISATQR